MATVKRFNNLSGSMNLASSPLLIGENQSLLLYNLSQDSLGAVSHRRGSTLLDSVAESGSVKGLASFNKSDGTHYVHLVHGGDLYILDEGTSNFGTQESSIVGSSSTVEFTNFLGRHYFIGSGDTEYLSYTSNTGSLTVVSGNIEGTHLDSNGAYLMVVGGVTEPLRAYWSNLASDTFTTDRDYVDLTEYPTGVKAFGNGRNFVIFSESSYMEVDPSTGYTNEVPGFGLPSGRAAVAVGGALCWMSRTGRSVYVLLPDESFPQEISIPIKNDDTQGGIIGQIAGGTWDIIAGGEFSSSVYFAVSDLAANIQGQDVDNCIIEYDFGQQSFKIHGYPDIGAASVFCKHITTTGDMWFLAGSLDDGSVYRLEVPGVWTDNENDVTAVYRSIHQPLEEKNSSPVQQSNIQKLHFVYYATSALTLKYSTNGATTYTTHPAQLPVTAAGRLYDFAVATVGLEGKTVSIELSGTGEWRLFSWAVEFEAVGDEGINYV